MSHAAASSADRPPTGASDPAGGLAADELATIQAEVDAEIAAEQAARRRMPAPTVGIVALIGGALSLVFSFVLSVEKLTLTENPDATLSCDINPFVSCGNVILTAQASAFGVPNPFLGLVGYAIVVTYGVLLLARVQLPHWFHLGALAGLTFAFGFIHWLAYQSMFVIGSLCPWCMVVWAATAPVFFHLLAWNAQEGHLPVSSGVASALVRFRWVFTIAWYLLVLALILVVFWNQWLVVWGV